MALQESLFDFDTLLAYADQVTAAEMNLEQALIHASMMGLLYRFNAGGNYYAVYVKESPNITASVFYRFCNSTKATVEV